MIGCFGNRIFPFDFLVNSGTAKSPTGCSTPIDFKHSKASPDAAIGRIPGLNKANRLHHKHNKNLLPKLGRSPGEQTSLLVQCEPGCPQI